MKQALYFNGDDESLVLLDKCKNSDIIFTIETIDNIQILNQMFNIEIKTYDNITNGLLLLKEQDIKMIISTKNTANFERKNDHEDGYCIIIWYPLVSWTNKEISRYIQSNNLLDLSLIINKKIGEFPIIFISKAITSGGLGRKLNYPFLNLAGTIDMKFGIYYGIINIVDNYEEHKILLNYSKNNPIEIYILQVTRAYFYDKMINVTLIGFIREYQRFADIDVATEAVENDIKIATDYLRYVKINNKNEYIKQQRK